MILAHDNDPPTDRRPPRQSESELLAYLVELSGRKISSREDIKAYVAEVAENAKRKNARRAKVKSALLAGLLIFAALQYYFIDVQLEILGQPSLTVFYPLKDAPPKQIKI